MLHAQLAAVALGATALAAAGCGSSKAGSAATTAASTTAPVTSTNTAKLATSAPLSRARWIAGGDAICKQTLAKIETLGFYTPAQLARVLPRAVPYYAAEAEELAKLVPPKSKAHDWEQVVNDVHAF